MLYISIAGLHMVCYLRLQNEEKNKKTITKLSSVQLISTVNFSFYVCVYATNLPNMLFVSLDFCLFGQVRKWTDCVTINKAKSKYEHQKSAKSMMGNYSIVNFWE